ncbi:MAG: UTP--glucose-1-phosphate uridylyltransferase [Opitutales bacterium]|nr:UTP--glucose-1-phosphate uridylyltransferase [Opitutales bacterium]
MDASALLEGCEALEAFWLSSESLYERVRALAFLAALHRYVLPARGLTDRHGRIPHTAHEAHLQRRFREAIRALREAEDEPRRNDTVASGLATAYERLALQFLADQVRLSVRSVPGNQWMFRVGHAEAYPLRLRPELRGLDGGAAPVLREATAVRMDLSHSSWSDIFFLGMDRPEFARVLNVSINLAPADGEEQPRPPVEAYFRVIDRPVIRLVSIDLEAQAEVSSLAELFDFGRDYLGLLKAAVIAAGVIPPGVEGSPQPLETFLERLIGPGLGFELVSNVNNIPKGSRLAVSTNLLASLIAVSMRATGQAPELTGPLPETVRRVVAARAILGEWLGGSGGGWQDSGGVWPGIKLIEGCLAEPGDAEHGVSRGKLLPRHTVFDRKSIPESARQALERSLILVHGGMAQNVGPILEMVTERYLLRSGAEWTARAESLATTDRILGALRAGDIRKLGELTTGHFFGPLTTIIPWATNAFTEALIARAKDALGDAFWGFWMLGGMSGGGMGFIVDPSARAEAKGTLAEILRETKCAYETALPFAMDPVVYNFSINEDGSSAAWCGAAGMPAAYYRLRLPGLLRKRVADLSGDEAADLRHIAGRIRATGQPAPGDLAILTNLLPDEPHGTGGADAPGSLEALLAENGFDPEQHEAIRRQLLAGSVGLAQNRLPGASQIEDVEDRDLLVPAVDGEALRRGKEALANGEVAVVTLAAGAGSRWTQGAGVVKALHPFARFAGCHRNFIEAHMAKSRRSAMDHGAPVPHVFTTSYLTHQPVSDWLERTGTGEGDAFVRLRVSKGQSVGLRFVPTLRDLRFAWEELPQEQLDEQAHKMRLSGRRALMRWAESMGEGSDYRDNTPLQCLHPVGHWYEVPNLLLNGTLAQLLKEQPSLKTLLVHNIDCLGAGPDPAVLGAHLDSGALMSVEVIPRRFEDHGGGLAKIDGRNRLVEGMALPREEDEFKLRYYNALTTWVSIDEYLAHLGLSRGDLGDTARVRAAVRRAAARMPAYMTLKEVKKRWGRGQEDIFPVLQFERLWGDLTALPDVRTAFIRVSRARGRQLKDPAQLDAWLRDGGRDHIESIGAW